MTRERFSDKSFRGRQVVIMGLGQYPQGSGLGAAKFMLQRGARVLVTDLKTQAELKDQVKRLKRWQSIYAKSSQLQFVLGRHQRADFNRADLIIRNHSVPKTSPWLELARSRQIPVETDISLFFTLVKNQIIGITGTRGKTTTSTLIFRLLRSAYPRVLLAGNSFQSPLLLWEKITPTTIIVLELSSWMLESLEQHCLSPKIAVVTNIFPDHLNIHTSWWDYLRAKSLIFTFQREPDWVIANYDNAEVRRLAKAAPAQIMWFSRLDKKLPVRLWASNGWIYYHQNRIVKPIISLAGLKIKGQHNIENVLAAVGVALVKKVPANKIQAELDKFSGVPERLELVRTVAGVKYYNDTTATIPEATQAALQTLGTGKNIVLIAGGEDKGLRYQGLRRFFRRYVQILILLPGTASKRFPLTKINCPVIKVKTLSAAVRQASQAARAGSVVLLSPAAASFNLFQNEFDRGRQYVELIKALR